ncbi:MAG: class I SAM-dependent methyltransferase [Planctomycetota bacterium]|jgi:hypothetical protein
MSDAVMAMERLDFQLPDFVRLSWVSDAAREVWGPRLQATTDALNRMEWLSVVSGIRSCAILMASPEKFIARAREWVKHGLSALPLEIQGVSNYSYASSPVKTEPGKPFQFRIVLGTPQNVATFHEVWEACDEREIGRLLGYPPCCQEFFIKVWVNEASVDTTWAMGVATAAPLNGDRVVEVSGPPEANGLWRWMNVRAAPHLPCRFDCQPTVEFAKQFIGLGRQSGYDREMDWMLEMLSWPAEWSALHGIAEIKTPILKVSTRTDATPCKYVVRRKGDDYPPEGAQGVLFPFRTSCVPSASRSARFQRGLENPISPLEQHPAWYASDNGFRATFVMDRAHRPIVELAKAVLDGRGGNVLDLGCGNGALLKKIHEADPDTVPFGIEAQSDRYEHIRLLLPQFAENFTLGNIFKSDDIWPDGRRYALVLLFPGRLLEAEAEPAEQLRQRIRRHCDHLLVNVYEDDWVTRYGSLKGLASKAGLQLLNWNAGAMVSLAKV